MKSLHGKKQDRSRAVEREQAVFLDACRVEHEAIATFLGCSPERVRVLLREMHDAKPNASARFFALEQIARLAIEGKKTRAGRWA